MHAIVHIPNAGFHPALNDRARLTCHHLSSFEIRPQGLRGLQQSVIQQRRIAVKLYNFQVLHSELTLAVHMELPRSVSVALLPPFIGQTTSCCKFFDVGGKRRDRGVAVVLAIGRQAL